MQSVIRDLKSQNLPREELEKKVAELRLPNFIGLCSKYSVVIIVFSLWFIPFLLSILPYYFAPTESVQKLVFLLISPITFALTFIVLAGLVSRLGQAGIVPGKFPRIAEHPIYALRRIYGAAWSQLYYFKPLYAICLAIPTLRWVVFRLFGYKGNLDITVFPDSWIRDLPLLDFGKGVYLANRATLGSNMCLTDGSILIGKMKFGEGALIGHMVLIALGSRVGKKSEFGVNAAGGIRINVGDNVSVRPRSNLNHGCIIGNNCIIGTAALVGLKAEIGEGIEIRSGASIPPGAIIKTQEEADRYFSAETQNLRSERDMVLDRIEELKYGSRH